VRYGNAYFIWYSITPEEYQIKREENDEFATYIRTAHSIRKQVSNLLVLNFKGKPIFRPVAKEQKR
jgi:hypothetical protein